MTVLVVTHVYYKEMWPELQRCIAHIKAISSCHLIVTMVEAAPDLEAEIKTFDPDADVFYVANKGWDVCPFFYVINGVNLDDYDYVVKLHTKRDVETSPYWVNGFDMSGIKWRSYLLRFCSTVDCWKKSLDTLQKENVGMVADTRVILTQDDEASVSQEQIALWEDKLSLQYQGKKKFVAGTMFAVKAEILKKLQNRFSDEDFANTVRVKEGSFAHVLERIFGYTVISAGYDIVGFDGKTYSVWRFFKRALLRFFFYHKVSPQKEIIKICGVPLYRRRF